jgi:predicted DNA-binding transcriptional regulator AlpA
MPDPLAGLPPRFLRTPEAARFLGLSGRTLEKHRTYGTGPTYRKIGGRVIYALDDLRAWPIWAPRIQRPTPVPARCSPQSELRCRATSTATRTVVERHPRC